MTRSRFAPGLLTLMMAVTKVPSTARADGASAAQVEDLLLVPAKDGVDVDAVYLRALCSYITERPGLARRYRNVFFGGAFRSQVDQTLTELHHLRAGILKGEESQIDKAIKRATAAMENTKVAGAVHYVCKSATEGQSTTANLPIRAVFTQWRDLGSHGTGIQFVTVTHDFPADRPPSADAAHEKSGFLPLRDREFSAAIRTLATGLLRQGDEPVFNVTLEVGGSTPCNDLRCVSQPDSFLVTLRADDSDFLRRDEIQVSVPEECSFVDEQGHDARSAVEMVRGNVTSEASSATIHFRRSGRFYVRAPVRAAARLGLTLGKTHQFGIKVVPRGLLVDSRGGLSRLNVAITFVGAWYPGGRKLPQMDEVKWRLGSLRILNGAAMAALPASFLDEVPRVSNAKLSPATVQLASAVIQEDELRSFVTFQPGFEADFFSIYSHAYPDLIKVDEAVLWCLGLEKRIFKEGLEGTIVSREKSEWRAACSTAMRTVAKCTGPAERERRCTYPAATDVPTLHFKRRNLRSGETYVGWIDPQAERKGEAFELEYRSFGAKDRETLGALLGGADLLPIEEEFLVTPANDQSAEPLELALRYYDAPATMELSAGTALDRPSGKVRSTILMDVGLHWLWSSVRTFGGVVLKDLSTDKWKAEFSTGLAFSPSCLLSHANALSPWLQTACRRFDLGVSSAFNFGRQTAYLGPVLRTKGAGPFLELAMDWPIAGKFAARTLAALRLGGAF
jgi:hypothetical protein